ncbi:MAG: hypothetical protein JXA44_02590 [Methanospirillaceae archaeon]|nr:hypothetical protein [Methanospirillaceae archaeon]
MEAELEVWIFYSFTLIPAISPIIFKADPANPIVTERAGIFVPGSTGNNRIEYLFAD